LVTISLSGISNTVNLSCCGFSRSAIWQLVWTVVKYGPLLLWHMIPQKPPLQHGFLNKLLGVKKGTDTYCVLREPGQMPIFLYLFRCTMQFWNSLLSSNNPLLDKAVRADLHFFNRSDTWTFIRFRTRTKKSLGPASPEFGSRYDLVSLDLVSLSIWNSLSSLCANNVECKITP
jgi:hypothetical protein